MMAAAFISLIAYSGVAWLYDYLTTCDAIKARGQR